jgi:DNA-binding response OmpR family regulator
MTSDYRLLIIEDNPRIRMELTLFLESNGFSCTAPQNFERLVEETDFSSMHLVLLDINLPGVDGFYLCRKIREVSEVPVIVVTSRDTELDELMAMNCGADDYVTKPYHPQILLARVTSVLRRTYRENTTDRDRVHCGSFDLGLSRSVLIYNGEETELTKNELRILSSLQEHLGEIVSREELMTQLWNSDLFVDDNTLTVNVNRLRSKLTDIGLCDVIETRRGQGYLLKENTK